jgi:site-specific DNA recombinase
MYAAEWGQVRIAKAMNNAPAYAAQNREFFGGQRVPPPRRRTGSWSPTAVREMLYRRLYRGEIVWGQTTHIDRDGRAGVRTSRPASEWIVIPAPELKIIDDELWDAVHARLHAAKEHYLRDGRGKLWGKPDARREGNFLLTSMARCGVCGWKLSVLGGRRRVYGCSHAWRRGVCANHLKQPVELVDTAFLRALERDVLTPERFRYALACGVEHLRQEMAHDPNRRPALERERTALTVRIGRMVAAIGEGQGPAALVEEIATAEARVKEIEEDLGRLATLPALEALDLAQMEDAVAAQLSRFAELIRGNIPRARQALKKLLVDAVDFTPVTTLDGQQTYSFKGDLTYGAVLHEVIYMRGVPRGIRTPVLGLKGRRPRPD